MTRAPSQVGLNYLTNPQERMRQLGSSAGQWLQQGNLSSFIAQQRAMIDAARRSPEFADPTYAKDLNQLSSYLGFSQDPTGQQRDTLGPAINFNIDRLARTRQAIQSQGASMRAGPSMSSPANKSGTILGSGRQPSGGSFSTQRRPFSSFSMR